ncbi:MAG: PAS domain-containing protein [Myxococcota bacterium]
MAGPIRRILDGIAETDGVNSVFILDGNGGMIAGTGPRGKDGVIDHAIGDLSFLMDGAAETLGDEEGQLVLRFGEDFIVLTQAQYFGLAIAGGGQENTSAAALAARLARRQLDRIDPATIADAGAPSATAVDRPRTRTDRRPPPPRRESRHKTWDYLEPASSDALYAAGETPRGAASPGPSSAAAGTAAFDLGEVQRLSPRDIDGLAYGVIVLDSSGRVVEYSDTEARLAQLPRERVIGKDFFREVAPCTRVQQFEGRFRQLAQDPNGVRTQTFDFVFEFSHSVQHVTIIIVPARRRGHFNVALLRRSVTPNGPMMS